VEDSQSSGGNLVNILSNDCSRVESSVYLMSYLIVAPLEATAVILILVYLIDISVLYGLVVLVVALPVQAVLAKLFDHLRFVFLF
jgi:ATP-binding cassette subfamily C (CFTR/MRP) protein 4